MVTNLEMAQIKQLDYKNHRYQGLHSVNYKKTVNFGELKASASLILIILKASPPLVHRNLSLNLLVEVR